MRDTQDYACITQPKGRSLVTDKERATLTPGKLGKLAYRRWMERRMTGKIAARGWKAGTP